MLQSCCHRLARQISRELEAEVEQGLHRRLSVLLFDQKIEIGAGPKNDIAVQSLGKRDSLERHGIDAAALQFGDQRNQAFGQAV